ncbi:MAG: enoyl-CoA hydratase-related protein [Pseudomonadales bacterium]|nr:enoyl-CoA hydratase-related protein [Pseudomonadales bacterium]
MALVNHEIRRHVSYLTINRPEVRNALSPQTYFELSEILNTIEGNDDIWLAVLTGAGDKAFSAGRDLKQMSHIAKASTEEQQAEKLLWEKTTRLTDRFDFSKPLIARLNGSAYGGGLELALACDIIVAADHAQLGLPEPTRGLIAMAGGVHRLPRQIGLKVAMGYLLTGRSMTAARGYELGLVNQVVSSDRLDEATQQWVDDVLRCAPIAVRATKQCVMQGLDYPLPKAMANKYGWEEIRKGSLDTVEGPNAFSEKRQPKWQGK